MVKEDSNAAPAEPTFRDIRIGLGEEWNFEHEGPLTGHYLGQAAQDIDGRNQNVYQFAPLDNPDEVVFVWGSDQLDRAFASGDIRMGSLMRITFLGRDQFTDRDSGQPRQVKRYRVQVAD